MSIRGEGRSAAPAVHRSSSSTITSHSTFAALSPACMACAPGMIAFCQDSAFSGLPDNWIVLCVELTQVELRILCLARRSRLSNLIYIWVNERS